MDNEPDYLSIWLEEMKAELDGESIRLIYDTLHANQFNSRLKLKLISKEHLQIMFNGATKLSLEIMAVLQFKLEELKDESPLVKGRKIPNSFRSRQTEECQSIEVITRYCVVNFVPLESF